MDISACANLHAERPNSQDKTSAPRSSVKKRTRTSGSKNLKQHEWALVHQHLLRRNNENKDTVFIIHGVKHEWRNVHRKILRANGLIEPREATGSPPQLPSYIELRSPSPGYKTLPQTKVVDLEPTLNNSAQRPEQVHTSMWSRSLNTTSDRQIDESNTENEDYYTERAGNDVLRKLPLSEFLTIFLREDWRQPRCTQASFHVGSFNAIVRLEDSLETFVDRLYTSGYPGHRMSYLGILRMLDRECQISSTELLESVIRTGNGREVDTLKWLRLNDFLGFGTKLLGTAAYLNDFKTVDMLLDEFVDIKGAVFSPHSTPCCPCQMSLIDYAQLPRLESEDSGASEEMIAYLSSRGAAKSTGVNMGLLGLLDCVLRQNGEPRILLSKVQPVISRIHGLFDITRETDSFLETCVLTGTVGGDMESRFEVFEYLLDEIAQTSFGSPLVALIYMNGPKELILKLLAKTERIYIDNYCNSVSRNHRFRRPQAGMRPWPYNLIQSVNPLQIAALHGREEIVHLMLQNGADVNCPARGSCGVTPLQAITCLDQRLLCRTTKIRIMTLFLHHGANINAAPAWNRGLSALQAAAFVGDVQVAELLVRQGADVNAPACRYGGGTALALATRMRHVDMVHFLLGEGAAIPPAGVTVSSFGVTYDDNHSLLDLLRISHVELVAIYGRNGTPSRDYHEYEAEWAADPTYDLRTRVRCGMGFLQDVVPHHRIDSIEMLRKFGRPD